MLNKGNFRKNLIDLIDNPDKYTKDHLYDAFLEISERYLEDMVSTLCFENYIIKKYGEEKGNEIIEAIAASNPDVVDLERTNAREEDKRTVIKNLLVFTECEFGFDLSEGNEGD